MNIAVGCPVTNRAWILPQWFKYTKEAFKGIGVDPFFVFVLGTSADTTPTILQEHITDGVVEYEQESPESGKIRGWNQSRYEHMVVVRNRLLEVVREVKPDYFLSLDSDILIHPQVLQNLLETQKVRGAAAVGGKCYLTEQGRHASNYAWLTSVYGLRRPDSTEVFRVDVLMAVKLMTKAAYEVDYRTHAQGEDIGWSMACREQRLLLDWDGRTCSKHVMSPERLNEVDSRCGY